MVNGGTIPRGGRFTSARSYRGGTHNGLDIAAPEGTDINLPEMGAAMTVTKVHTSTPSRGAGNYVTLEGNLPNGDRVQLTLGHMKQNSINVALGQQIPAGTLIGKVGNTGMTSDKTKGGVTAWYEGKSSGFHVDIKLKINGHYVDPETYNPANYGAGLQEVSAPISPDLQIPATRMSSQDIFDIPFPDNL